MLSLSGDWQFFPGSRAVSRIKSTMSMDDADAKVFFMRAMSFPEMDGLKI